jgi:hypothetical protein
MPGHGICGSAGMAKVKKRESAVITPERPAVPAPEVFEPRASTSTAPQSVGDTTVAAPERDRIAMRAYELYLERGRGEGRELDDWLRAEQEVSSGTGSQSRG